MPDRSPPSFRDGARRIASAPMTEDAVAFFSAAAAFCRRPGRKAQTNVGKLYAGYSSRQRGTLK